MNGTTGADTGKFVLRSDQCHQCRSVARFAFPIWAMTRDSGDSCSPLPAYLSQIPHPPCAFVENKSQTPIRKACRKLVDPSFSRFSGLQLRSISACFFRFYCSVGTGPHKGRFGLTAELIANFQRPLTAWRLPRWEEMSTLPFVRCRVDMIDTRNCSQFPHLFSIPKPKMLSIKRSTQLLSS